MRPCNESEITVNKFLSFCHYQTERIAIHVIGGRSEFWLTKDAASSTEEMDRLIKYYGEVPLWNLHVGYETDRLTGGMYYGRTSCIVGVLVANCKWSDVEPCYRLEKEDIKRAKRHQQYLARKEKKSNESK